MHVPTRGVLHLILRFKVMSMTKLDGRLAVASIVMLILIGCAPAESNRGAPILLFNGTGTSRNDVAAIGVILKGCGWEYDTADSVRLNRMSESDLKAYRLIIVPGGNYLTMGSNLTPEATERVHNAIHRGVNYLGICAGGLLAGKAQCNSLNLTSGVKFDFYAVVNQGIHKAAVPINCVDTPVIEHYWEDGPQFTGWGQVVGKYPDETPAIVEGAVGEGWVILCGVHPEAPESWRRGMVFTTSSRAANDYTATLIEAALHGRPLAHY